MADSQRSSSKTTSSRSPSLPTSKPIRSQKIIQMSPSEMRPPDIPEDTEPPTPREHSHPHAHAPPTRSHTPGHLSTKSQDRRKKSSDLALRQRSQSMSQKDSHNVETPKSSSKRPPSRNGEKRPPSRGDSASRRPPSRGSSSSKAENPLSPPAIANTHAPPSASPIQDPRRPTNLRSTSAIAPKPSIAVAASRESANSSPVVQQRNTPSKAASRTQPILHPPLHSQNNAPDVQPAPASGMYWSRAPVSGASHTSLRAHTTTLIGSNIYIFGGCDSRSCFNELYVLDADAFFLSSPFVSGDIPVPLRAMTCTAVGKKLIVFGGGDGPAYYNDVYVLDTVNFRWTKPKIGGDRQPSKRRAHTACLYRNGIYVFGGGDGVRALNDVWRLDVSDTSKMSWKCISAPTSNDPTKPKARGYHTANMVGSKLIIFGGSDGGECFRDVWVFDVETLTFSPVNIPVSYPRLSHTATIVGSYLFVVGGHDGVEYSNEVLLLNLVTMNWDKRKVYGQGPRPRGYAGAVLFDSRVVVIGGFDGGEVFGDVWLLELAVHAYYSQISHFSIEV